MPKKVKARSSRRGAGRVRKEIMMDPRGAGFFGDLWSGVKKVAGPVVGIVNDGLKESKLISGYLAPKIPYLGDVVAGIARNHGYGKKKRMGRGIPLAITRT